MGGAYYRIAHILFLCCTVVAFRSPSGLGGRSKRDGERDRRGRQRSEKGSDECNGSSALSIHTQHALTKEKQSRNGIKTQQRKSRNGQNSTVRNRQNSTVIYGQIGTVRNDRAVLSGTAPLSATHRFLLRYGQWDDARL
jgi:hypothetical protein